MSPLQSPLELIKDWRSCTDVDDYIEHVLATPDDVATVVIHTKSSAPESLNEKMRKTYEKISQYLKEHQDEVDASYTRSLDKLEENVKMVKAMLSNVETREMKKARGQAEKTIRSL